MKYLFTNARILKMNGEKIFFGDLIVDGNRIKYVGPSKEHKEKFDRIIDCQKNLLMPGFKNAHTHSAMVFLRSFADDLPLQSWLFNYCFPAEAHLTEDDIYHLSKVAFLEYLTSGITACFDMYFYVPKYIKACEDFGMRSLICLMPNKYCTKEDMGRLYEQYENKDCLTKICFSLHSEYTTSKEDVDLINELVHKYHAPFYTHLSETKKEVEECINKRGISPVQYFVDSGLFDYGGGGYHCVHMSDHDLDLFKEKGLTVVSNPGSNSKLASGICDIERIRNKGINIALGTDGPASNNCLDMFKEMSLIYSLSKLYNNDASATPAYEILKMATVNGSKALNLKDADTLEENKLADIIMIDLSRPNMQPILNIENNIVFAGSKENIKMTMINGKILYENGEFFVGEDINDIYKKAQEIAERILKEVGRRE